MDKKVPVRLEGSNRIVGRAYIGESGEVVINLNRETQDLVTRDTDQAYSFAD